MSQYLSNFYCGNKRGLCNYNKPVDYSKLLNRNYDASLHKILEDCKGKEFEKGYCCDPVNKELQKPMDDEYMEHLNKKFEANIFTKDRSGNFHKGQIPLIKPLTQNGELKAMEVCACGGDSKDFVKCVSENCEDYRYPTRYEYCKLGSELNKTYCVLGSETPSDSGTVQDRCQLQPVDKDTQYTYSHNFKIKDLYPDCYLNMCIKDPKLQVLDQMINTTTTDENKYYKIKGDSLPEYGYLKDHTQINKDYQDTIVEDKSLLKYFSL
jgi:hypothetical protein